MDRFSTTFFIKAWYFFFTLLCVITRWLLPPAPQVVPWRAMILILALFGVWNFIRSLTMSLVVEEERLVMNLGFNRKRVLGWGQVARAEHRDIGQQHALRLYTLDGLALETNSRWIERLEELADAVVARARLTNRGQEGNRLLQGLWEVWTVAHSPEQNAGGEPVSIPLGP